MSIRTMLHTTKSYYYIGGAGSEALKSEPILKARWAAFRAAEAVIPQIPHKVPFFCRRRHSYI